MKEKWWHLDPTYAPTKFKLKNCKSFIPNLLILMILVLLFRAFFNQIGFKITESHQTDSVDASFEFNPEMDFKDLYIQIRFTETEYNRL